jgi:hypothetical protein
MTDLPERGWARRFFDRLLRPQKDESERSAEPGTMTAAAPVQRPIAEGIGKGVQIRDAEIEQDVSRSAASNEKGNMAILRGTDGRMKTAVTLDVARRFGGVSKRAIERAAEKGALRSEGKRTNRRITVESLLKYFPPEYNAT